MDMEWIFVFFTLLVLFLWGWNKLKQYAQYMSPTGKRRK